MLFRSGQNVLASLTPGQQVVKIVHEELIELLGGESSVLEFKGKPPYVIMMAGLQGSGKTTSSAKLAQYLRRQKYTPYLVPADMYRPAAIDQLQKLGAELGIPVYPSTVEMNPVDICVAALREAELKGCSVVLLDTAGRLHIDEPLMQELAGIKEKCRPHEILFVADAMTGQDAVTVAEKFDKALDITSVVLTKMEEVELSWQILDPILAHWETTGAPEQYRPGSWGPASAHNMMTRDGRAWRLP